MHLPALFNFAVGSAFHAMLLLCAVVYTGVMLVAFGDVLFAAVMSHGRDQR